MRVDWSLIVDDAHSGQPRRGAPIVSDLHGEENGRAEPLLSPALVILCYGLSVPS